MIREKIKKNVFSINGISLIIGIVGGIFGIISPFITNWNISINLKWVIAIIIVGFFLILILLKICIDLRDDLKKKNVNNTKIISFLSQEETFLAEINHTLGHGALVSIFYIENNYEIDFGKGYITNIQDNFIQIKLLQIANNFQVNYDDILNNIRNNNSISIQKLVVKSFVKYE